MTIIPFSLKKNAFYSVGRLPGLTKALGSWKGIGVILCYHRVLPRTEVLQDTSPNQFLAVSEESFDRQMRYLASHYDVITMDELASRHEKGKKNFGVVVTFDDGYRDNLRCAIPILKNYKIPVLLYMTTRFLSGDTFLWWFDLWERLLEKNHVQVIIGKTVMQWKTSRFQDKLRCFDSIRRLMTDSGREEQEALLKQVLENRPIQQYPHLCLTRDEVTSMDHSGLVSIGAHTHSHNSLAILTESQVEEEMIRSKTLLEELLGKTVRHFAYPFGGSANCGPREALLAEQMGFTTAVTTAAGSVNQKRMPFFWPRIQIKDHMDGNKMKILFSGLTGLTGKAP